MKRRTMLGAGAVAAGLAATAWWQRNAITRSALAGRQNDGVALSATPTLEGDLCILTPVQAEGPFFFSAPLRADIREDRVGLPLNLQLQVVQADGCQPVEGALVEIWHCDAAGRYSGYPEDLSRAPFDTLMYVGGTPVRVPRENQKTYLRGAQLTDASGMVNFSTILPGWYEPRTTHIHVQAFVEGQSRSTTQLYFPEDVTQEIYGNHVDYVAHGLMPYGVHNDMVLGQYPDGEGLLINPKRRGDGLVASGRLGIA